MDTTAGPNIWLLASKQAPGQALQRSDSSRAEQHQYILQSQAAHLALWQQVLRPHWLMDDVGICCQVPPDLGAHEGHEDSVGAWRLSNQIPAGRSCSASAKHTHDCVIGRQLGTIEDALSSSAPGTLLHCMRPQLRCRPHLWFTSGRLQVTLVRPSSCGGKALYRPDVLSVAPCTPRSTTLYEPSARNMLCSRSCGT